MSVTGFDSAQIERLKNVRLALQMASPKILTWPTQYDAADFSIKQHDHFLAIINFNFFLEMYVYSVTCGPCTLTTHVATFASFRVKTARSTKLAIDYFKPS